MYGKKRLTWAKLKRNSRTEEVESGWRRGEGSIEERDRSRLGFFSPALAPDVPSYVCLCTPLFVSFLDMFKNRQTNKQTKSNNLKQSVYHTSSGLVPRLRWNHQTPSAKSYALIVFSTIYWVFVFSHDPLTKNAARVLCQFSLFVHFLDLLSRSAPSGNLWHAYTVDQNARFARSKRHRPSSPSRHPDRRRIVGSIDRPTTTSSINDNSVRSPNGYCVAVRACISEDR